MGNDCAGLMFKALIKIGENLDDFWTWQGHISKSTGYGAKSAHGKTIPAHRWVYQIFNGWIPKGLVINHLCRNRACVNPRHLEATTHAGNCRHGLKTKLSREQVIEIKDLLSAYTYGDVKKIADRFGVSQFTISSIKAGRAWKDVNP